MPSPKSGERGRLEKFIFLKATPTPGEGFEERSLLKNFKLC